MVYCQDSIVITVCVNIMQPREMNINVRLRILSARDVSRFIDRWLAARVLSSVENLQNEIQGSRCLKIRPRHTNDEAANDL